MNYKTLNKLFLDGEELRLTLKYLDKTSSYDISLIHRLDDKLLYKVIKFPAWKTSDYVKKPSIKSAISWVLRQVEPGYTEIASLFINNIDLVPFVNCRSKLL